MPPSAPLPPAAAPVDGPGAPALRATVHTALSPGLRAAWAALDQRAERVPVSLGLLEAAGRLRDRALRLVAVTAGDTLVGLWPLEVQQLGPARVASRLGGPLQPYDGLTLAPGVPHQAAQAAAWAALRAADDLDLVRLDALDAGDLLLRDPEAAAGARRHTAAGRVVAAGAPPLLARQSKSRRKTVRRRRRQLEALGPVAFHRITAPAARVRALETALSVKEAWLDQLDALGLVFRSAGFQDGLRGAVAVDPARSMLEMFQLTVDGQPVAWELCHRDPRSLRSFLGCYRPDLAPLGVGVALSLETVAWAAAQGIGVYDFLPPLTDFKRAWADHERSVAAVVLPLRLRGRPLVPLLRDGRRVVKQAWERLAPEGAARLLLAG